MSKRPAIQLRYGIAASQVVVSVLSGYAAYRWSAHEFLRSIAMGVFCAQITLVTLWLLLGESLRRIAIIPTIVLMMSVAKALEICETAIGVPPQYANIDRLAAIFVDALGVALVVAGAVALPFLAARVMGVVSTTVMRRDGEVDRRFTFSIRQVLAATTAVSFGAWAAAGIRSGRIPINGFLDVDLALLLASVSVTGVGSVWAALSRRTPTFPACAVACVAGALLFCSDYATGALRLWLTLSIAAAANFTNVLGTLLVIRSLGYRIDLRKNSNRRGFGPVCGI